MHDLLRKYINISSTATLNGSNGVVDFNATGDKWAVRGVAPIDVYRWGIVTIELMDPDAGGFQIDLEKRILMGSDVGRLTQIQSIFRADADLIPAGQVVYVESVLAVAAAAGSDGSVLNVDPAGPIRVNPGEELVFKVSNAVGAASTGYIWVEYTELPFNAAGSTKITLDT